MTPREHAFALLSAEKGADGASWFTPSQIVDVLDCLQPVFESMNTMHLEAVQLTMDALDYKVALVLRHNQELLVERADLLASNEAHRRGFAKLCEVAAKNLVRAQDAEAERDELVQRCERQAVTIEERQRSWQEMRAERDELRDRITRATDWRIKHATTPVTD